MVTGIAGLKRKKSCTLLSDRIMISIGLCKPRKGPQSDDGTNLKLPSESELNALKWDRKKETIKKIS